MAIAVGISDHWAIHAADDFRELDLALRPTAVLVFEEVDEVETLASAEPAEVDDDVEAFGDALLGQRACLSAQRAITGDRVLHDVAVVGNDMERHGAASAVDKGELEVARDAAIEDAEAVLAGADVEERAVLPVGQQSVAEEAVVLKGVEPELTGAIPGFVGEHQVDVIVAVAPVKGATRRQAQVDAIVDGFIAAVDGTVVVHRREVALVDVLTGEIEHVVVEPVGAHRLAPVTAQIDDAAIAVRCAAARVAGAGVDRVVASVHHRPAIVIVLAREEEAVGEAVALRWVVTVVLVCGDRVQPKSAIGGRVDRQHVVVAEQDRLAVARHQQFWRQGAVKGPDGQRVLLRHARVELDRDAAIAAGDTGGVDVVQTAGAELTICEAVHLQAVAQAEAGASTGGCGLEVDLWAELAPPLVSEVLALWAPFSRRGGQWAAKELLDASLPRVLVGVVRFAMARGEQGLGQVGLDVGAVRHRLRAGQAREWCGSFHVGGGDRLAAKLLELQHLLGERLRAEHRARVATARDVEIAQLPRLQSVVRRGHDVGAIWALQRAGIRLGGRLER